jgi:hypothetical protein
MFLGRRPNIPKPLDRTRLGNQHGITPTAGQRFGAHGRIWADAALTEAAVRGMLRRRAGPVNDLGPPTVQIPARANKKAERL